MRGLSGVAGHLQCVAAFGTRPGVEEVKRSLFRCDITLPDQPSRWSRHTTGLGPALPGDW